MKLRSLGTSGLRVAPLCLGGDVFGWTADEATSFRILDAFVDAGFNLIDTADAYSRWAPGHQGGESEALIGRWLKHTGKRDRVLIATKVGMEMGDGRVGLSRKHILEAVDESLRRLHLDVIDLYQSHKDDLGVPVGETLAAYDELVRVGKVRAIGASQLSPERVRESLEFSRREGMVSYSCLQPLYNLYDRELFEKSSGPIAAEHGLGVISYYALAAGFLSGKYRTEADLQKSVRGKMRIEGAYLNPRGLRIIEALDVVAKRLGSSPASVAIAWVLTNPLVTAPIASATNLAQLESLVAATRLVLDAQSLEELRAATS
jgi:aryl-alcohol dehydrogenase-like predicted oxidoreductase